MSFTLINPFNYSNTDYDVVVVADLFVEDYVGGAELTTQALIDESKKKILKIRSRDLTQNLINQYKNKFWIFGNFSAVNPGLLQIVSMTLKYVILEYDYKFCHHRSIEKCSQTNGTCSCHTTPHGQFVERFFTNSQSIFWMSEKQKEIYHDRFPSLQYTKNMILSSIFSKQTLNLIKTLLNNESKSGTLVLGSNSWVKGFHKAMSWCSDNKIEPEIVWNMPYENLLRRLATAEQFVYLPEGSDTCPRMIIEAKLLGCKIITNEHVQHNSETWFNQTPDEIFNYLSQSPQKFWSIIEKLQLKKTISGYTTTMNCLKQGYPFEHTIKSMLEFCDEVCVVDGDSNDGTWEKLVDLAYPDAFQNLSNVDYLHLVEDLRALGGSPIQRLLPPTKLRLQCIQRDWSNPNFAIFDGLQKAEARKMCTSDYCWQMDSDEIVANHDVEKIHSLIQQLPNNVLGVSLPVIEFWGSHEKIRIDVTPWKWRLSKNSSNITHGVPGKLRVIDKHNIVVPYHAAPGTDGCDLIFVDSLEPVPHMTFYTPEVENIRQHALSGNQEALAKYESYINDLTNQIPVIYHYSWFDLERKIKLYKNYWTRHWESLFGKTYIDDAASNMMFDSPWSDVTDDMISDLATKLSSIGGWIWHSKWLGQKTPWITLKNKNYPL